ncbi:hypothetical protein DYB32_003381 [Aphanomyces invadans]|uniref:Uncharacterized protein n=1 Tax=Aphanomyces invadans TaxID=157072 RepID=A0A3R6VZP4_9STRA|nr:hypothetical protein DYB32_003381 [Aphanomyces invadans]
MSGGALILAPPTMLPSPMTATNMGSLDVSFGQTLAYHHTMYPPVSQDPHTRNFPRSVSFNSYFHDVVSTDASMPRGFSGSDVVHEYFTKAESAPPYPHHDHQQHHMATMASHAAHQASLSSGYRFGVPPYAFSSPLPVPPSASANMYTVPSSGGPSNHPSYHHQSLPHDEIAMHPSSFLPDPLPYPYPEQCTTGSPSMLYHPPLARLPHSHHTDGLAATHQAGTGIFSPPRRDLP